MSRRRTKAGRRAKRGAGSGGKRASIALVQDGGPPRIGISACLLGQEVRHDGGHKRDRLLVELLGPLVEWVPVCPEVEMGMGVPRESVRLLRRGGDLRMVAERSGTDHTDAMRAFSAWRVAELARLDLCGYVFKQGSPSCGAEGVPIHGAQGSPGDTGRGLFAAALIEALPDLPVEEEGRLHDPALRERFLERAFAYRRLRAPFAGRGAT